ncbi:MAG: thiamine phosphate synthase [Erythrobacter sp.]|nr:thiamine phosphate synthase [Erythrobacter sp.]
MLARYSGAVRQFQTLPALWLLSDERNDAVLDERLWQMPRGSGFVFRHYHLSPAVRVDRFFALRRIARSRGHCVILADSAQTAREWSADGIYGAARALYPTRHDLICIATAHDLSEIGEANRASADAVMHSPVYPTRTHPGAQALGRTRFRLLARHAQMPVIALGGMTSAGAASLDWPHWAAIDGLS